MLKTQQRKFDTKKKILIGSCFLKMYQDKPQELLNIMDKFLHRDADRKVFDLKPLNKSKL